MMPLKRTTQAMQIFLVLALATPASKLAVADIYSIRNQNFEVKAIPADVLEQRVLNAIQIPDSNQIGPETRPVVSRWSSPPCLQVIGGNQQTTVTLNTVRALVSSRLNMTLDQCRGEVAQETTVFFASLPGDSAKFVSLLQPYIGSSPLSQGASNFIAGRTNCYWRTKAARSGDLLIGRAIVASALGNPSETDKCLVLGLAASLGLINPLALMPDIDLEDSHEWREDVELTLLSLSILYNLSDTEVQGNRAQIKDAVHHLLLKMRVSP